jgi:solute carrier family 25 protein 34/35
MGMNPFDVVMNRLMNQVKSDPSVKPYRNSLDCLFRTVKDEGLMALTKGYVAHFLRIGPHGVFTLVLTDQLRSLYVKWKSA